MFSSFSKTSCRRRISEASSPARSFPGVERSVELVDPATGKVFLTYADAGPAVIDAAMDAAQEAQARWVALRRIGARQGYVGDRQALA